MWYRDGELFCRGALRQGVVVVVVAAAAAAAAAMFSVRPRPHMDLMLAKIAALVQTSS
jgi:hypothetical protein